jgi:hypothetical protein
MIEVAGKVAMMVVILILRLVNESDVMISAKGGKKG